MIDNEGNVEQKLRYLIPDNFYRNCHNHIFLGVFHSEV